MKQFDKYKTGVVVQTFTLDSDKPVDARRHVADLGDFMYDYIKHITKPWWRRKLNHKKVTNTFNTILNRESSIAFNLVVD